jgi:hypothetical protein
VNTHHLTPGRRSALGVTSIVALVTAVLLGLVGPVVAGAARDGDRTGSDRGGIDGLISTGAGFWTWALSQPAATNPITDTDGSACANGQRGRTWFLAGTFGPDPVVRRCVVPRGKRIAFPVLNNAFFAFESDPPEERTEEFVRGQAAIQRDASRLRVTVDGVPLRRGKIRYEESVLFSVTLPAESFFPLPEGALVGPSADAGYYVNLRPLRPGRHRIRIIASSLNAEGDPLAQDVTWRLVVPRRHHR